MYTNITGCMCAAASGCKLYMCIHLCTSVNVSARASWVHITHICVCVWQSASTPPRIVCMLYTYKYIYLCVCVCMCVCVCVCVCVYSVVCLRHRELSVCVRVREFICI